MPKTYVYKIKPTFKKHPDRLAPFGFNPYTDEKQEEIIYATAIVLPQSGSIFNYMKRAFEKIYEKATTEERKEFAEHDISYTEVLSDDQHWHYELNLTDDLIKEMTECQLCVADSGTGEWTLFVNAPDNIEYYNTEVLDESAPELIETLLKNKVIYKKRLWKKQF